MRKSMCAFVHESVCACVCVSANGLMPKDKEESEREREREREREMWVPCLRVCLNWKEGLLAVFD